MDGIEAEIRDITRADMRDTLGRLRTLASQLKHAGKIEDEEVCFRRLLVALSEGIRDEVCKLTGPENAARLLDPFSRPNGETI
jgi:hypothetical protein